MKQLVLTLVHGTFASSANWIKPDSEFVSRLRAGLPDCELLVLPFQWSGRNSHRGRLFAGEQLRHHLRRAAEQHPGCSQLVIAHSHGGNVALYATRPRQGQHPVTGIICLATPFIHAQPRHERFFGAIGILGWQTTLILPGIIAVKLFGGDFGGTLLLTTLNIIFVVLFGFLLLFIFGKLILDLIDHADARCALVSQNLEETELPILAVRMERDEASIWLRAMLFFSNLPERAWSCLEWVLVRSSMNYFWVGATAVGLMLVLAIVEAVGGKLAVRGLGILGDAIMLSATGLVFLPFLAAALVIPILLLVWSVGRLFRAGPLGFGEALLDNLILHIRVSDGNALVFPCVSRNDSRLWTLRHSQVYEDDFVIAHIADWINCTLEAHR